MQASALRGALFWAAVALIPSVNGQAALPGHATRFWDCCKPACSWPRFVGAVNTPVKMCDANQNPITDYSATSACGGGPAYSCADMTPQVVSPQLAMGFAAVNVNGETDNDWCCGCYKVTFTSGPATGQQMIVQAISTGGDMGGDQFDIMVAVPGLFDACHTQYNAPQGGWGQQWGGILDRSGCSTLPSFLQAGCQFRFDWFKGSDNIACSYEKLSTCPKALTDISGCIRTGQTPSTDITAGSSSGGSNSMPAALPAGGSSSSAPAIGNPTQQLPQSSPLQTLASGQGGNSMPAVSPTSPAAGQPLQFYQDAAGSGSSTPYVAPKNTPSNGVSNPMPTTAQAQNTPAPAADDVPFWAVGPSWNGQPGARVPGYGKKLARAAAAEPDDLPFWAVGPSWNGQPGATVPGYGGADTKPTVAGQPSQTGSPRVLNFMAQPTEGPDDECDMEQTS